MLKYVDLEWIEDKNEPKSSDPNMTQLSIKLIFHRIYQWNMKNHDKQDFLLDLRWRKLLNTFKIIVGLHISKISTKC